MHEVSLVQALLERVAETARAYQATAVQRVTVRIGRLAGVETALFASAWDVCRRGTVCDAAPLVIEDEDACWRCDACGIDVTEGAALVCAICGGPAHLARGDAMVLERLELEVPDV